MSENGPASESFTVKDESVAVPSIGAGSTGEFTAILGPVIIELEPIDAASHNRARRRTISRLL